MIRGGNSSTWYKVTNKKNYDPTTSSILTMFTTEAKRKDQMKEKVEVKGIDGKYN